VRGLISSLHILYIEAFELHKKYGGKGIHYVGGYTQAHLTLWIRRMVGMLQRPNAENGRY
jgi:hypothetical protein